MRGKQGTNVAGQLVAVKCLNLEGFPKRVATVAVRKEIETLQKLKHPNVVRYLADYKSNQAIYIVMELAADGSLADVITRHKEHLTDERVTVIMIELAMALEYVHIMCILHRDLKCESRRIQSHQLPEFFSAPELFSCRRWNMCTRSSCFVLRVSGENVLLHKGVVKLADFGLAHAFEDQEASYAQSVSGTCLYFSPEKAQGLPYSKPDDVWALGCILVELCAKQRLTEPRLWASNPQASERRESLIKTAWDLSPRLGAAARGMLNTSAQGRSTALDVRCILMGLLIAAVRGLVLLCSTCLHPCIEAYRCVFASRHWT
jgi:serine/threonine protein kinase